MINTDAISLLNWYYQRFPGQPFLGSEDDFLCAVANYRFLRSALIPRATKTLRVAHTMDVRFLADQFGFGTDNNFFDFASKVLNLLDDESFPVYNRQIALVFDKPFTTPNDNDIDYPGKDILDHQEAIYQDVVETYRDLQNHQIINDFRKEFNCPDFSFVKILDIVFTELGKLLDKEGYEPSPAEFLKEHHTQS